MKNPGIILKNCCGGYSTCPLMHPPAIMLGSEGLNLNENISSGASSRVWDKKEIMIKQNELITVMMMMMIKTMMIIMKTKKNY